MNPIAQKVSDYAYSIQFEDIDKDTIFECKKRLLDTLGCAIGASNERVVKESRSFVSKNYAGTRYASLLGSNVKSTVDVATFANGLMIRFFDLNDTYLSKEPAHPSDNIAACLATAESEKRSGRALLLSIVLAYEIQCRLCDAASLRSRGWDHVCYGLVSSALGAGKLLGLKSKQLENAVNISLNSHLAMRQVRAGELSDWKGFSFANAARNAVFSALLAREGITGPSPIFEGEMGFFRQVSGPFDLDADHFGGRSGSRYKLPETYVKFYPAEYHSQSAIWAALEARKEIEDPEKEIESVEIQTHEAGYTILGKDLEKWSPKTKETADHSLPYIVGMALLEGKVDNSTYALKKISNPIVLKFLKKIRVTEDKELTSAYPKHIANRLTVKLSDGKTITKQVDIPKGHPSNSMTTEEIEDKFRHLTKRFLKPPQMEKIIQFVWNIESEEAISPLLKMCIVHN